MSVAAFGQIGILAWRLLLFVTLSGKPLFLLFSTGHEGFNTGQFLRGSHRDRTRTWTLGKYVADSSYPFREMAGKVVNHTHEGTK
jgi:hypothetical protein